jgi:hypothetical protein
MAFSKINPGTWATNAQLTSTQMNNLDTDHANALDKTTAGDTIAGTVNFSGAGNVTANIANTVRAGIAAGIQSNAVGGINLAGGATDWPTFSAARTRTIIVPCTDIQAIGAACLKSGTFGPLSPIATATVSYPASTSPWGISTVTVNTGTTQSFPYFMPMRQMHNGATLSNVTWNFQPIGGHAGLPAYQPWFRVFRKDSVNGVAQELTSGGAVQLAAGSTGAYQTTQQLVMTCNQNNVVDTTAYVYFAILGDEGGTNALAGIQMYTLTLSFTAIADMRFP